MGFERDRDGRGQGRGPGKPHDRRRDKPRAAAPKDGPGIKNPYVRFRPLKKPPMERARSTLFDYPSQHYGKTEQGSAAYRGATPSHVIWQVLELFSRPNDVVVDPFCGSGTTLDVCKDKGRRGRGFDLAPHRGDIEKADARKLPLKAASVDVVFMDPPYADNLSYSDDPRCIGKLSAEEGTWSEAMAEVLAESFRVLKPGGHVAMFVCDVLHHRKSKQGEQRLFFPLGIELANLATSVGFTLVEHVAVVRHGKALDEGAGRQHAAREGFLLRGFSHLLVAVKADAE